MDADRMRMTQQHIPTGQSIEKIALDTSRDRFLSSAESVEYGLVDEVLVRDTSDKDKK